MGSVSSGTKRYRQINLAFFAAGFVTFITLYDVQPLLPVFSKEFGLPASLGSLPLSITSCALAITMLFAGTVSETFGRKRVMVASLVTTSALAFITSQTHSFSALLALRLLQGIALAGLPAIAMAYLSEEIAPASLASAIGLYISGNAIGGMTGRIFTASMTEWVSWRAALGVIGVVCLMLSLFFARSLPASSNFTRRPFAARYLFSSLLKQLQDPGLLYLYGVSFLIMGAFVTLYNYITFRLLAPPYSLTHSVVSYVFLVYLLGSFSSSMVGRQVELYGRVRMLYLTLGTMVLGALVTLSQDVATMVVGIALFTCGFFGAHTIASSWVGSRARTARAQAASIYLFSYYLGSSVSGTAGGLFWTSSGWEGVICLIVALLGMGLCCARRLSRICEAEGAASEGVAVLEAIQANFWNLPFAKDDLKFFAAAPIYLLSVCTKERNMPDLVRIADGVAIPVEMLSIWDRLSEFASVYGPVFEADVNRLGLNLRPIFNLNTSIGGEQAIAFGSATSSSLQFVVRPDIYRAMVGCVAH